MKKLLSMILITALVLTTGIPAFGAEADSQALEKAITRAKSVIQVPESYSDFNYSTSQNTVNGKAYTYWNLSWNDLKEGGSIYVTVDEDGNLTNYYGYKNAGPEEKGLSKITKAQGLSAAAAFLAKALPGYGARMKEIPNPDQRVYGNEYVYNFRLYVNDIPVDFAGATLSVNRFTGDVQSYYYNGITADLKLTSYPTSAGVIGGEKAATAYIEKIGVPLKYNSFFDYAKRSLRVFPVYEFSAYNKAIDAKTGEPVKTFADNYGIYRGADGMGTMESKDKGNGSSYTEEELKAIEKTQNLISREEAERIARQAGTDFGPLQYISLESHYIEKNKYIWNLSFEQGYASVNAATSELTSFSIYEDYRYNGGGMSKERAQAIAEDFLKKASPEKFAQMKLMTDENYYVGSEDSPYHYFNYVRQVNGIDFANNNFNVSVNKVTGKVVSYYSEWYDTASFPALDKVVGEEKAFAAAAVANIGNYGLVYKKVSETEIGLVYDFLNGSGMLMDAFTGQRINWDGTPYVMGVNYTDIKGNWAESMILQLQENGYYLPAQGDNKFNPRSVTTQIEFLRYLYSPVQSQYAEDDAFYNMLVISGIVKKEEINAQANLTRQEAAKFVTRYMGYDKLAQKTTIFRNFFRDTPAAGYQGYATIVYAFDIIKGDAAGNFAGTRTLNHAEAAKVIYKTLL